MQLLQRPYKMRKKLLIGLLFAILIFFPLANAIPTPSYYGKNNEIYDSWEICRTNAFGKKGFFRANGLDPIIVSESLGNYTNLAYEKGIEFAKKYPNEIERAEKIFYYVRNNVKYLSDDDQFGYAEFAQNADELAREIKKGKAFGDCEDYAILLAVIYKAAGYRSAIILVPGHAASLVYLPNYRKANYFWELEKKGWIWAEATGSRNPLGWTPEKFIGGNARIKEISISEIEIGEPSMEEVKIERRTPAEMPISFQALPFFSMIGFMFFLPFIRRFR